jgi:hypothetical protein
MQRPSRNIRPLSRKKTAFVPRIAYGCVGLAMSVVPLCASCSTDDGGGGPHVDPCFPCGPIDDSGLDSTGGDAADAGNDAIGNFSSEAGEAGAIVDGANDVLGE